MNIRGKKEAKGIKYGWIRSVGGKMQGALGNGGRRKGVDGDKNMKKKGIKGKTEREEGEV